MSWSMVGWVSVAYLLLSGSNRATDVVVRYRRSVRGGCGPFAIEVGLQDLGEICRRIVG